MHGECLLRPGQLKFYRCIRPLLLLAHTRELMNLRIELEQTCHDLLPSQCQCNNTRAVQHMQGHTDLKHDTDSSSISLKHNTDSPSNLEAQVLWCTSASCSECVVQKKSR